MALYSSASVESSLTAFSPSVDSRAKPPPPPRDLPPPIRVLDGRTWEALCEVQAEVTWNRRQLLKAVAQATGVPLLEIRLIWAGESLKPFCSLVDVLQSHTPIVRLVRTKPPWEEALDRVAASGWTGSPQDEELLEDRGFLLAAVQETGLSLRLGPEELRADEEVVLAAVRENGLALMYAAEAMRSSKEVVLVAAANDGACLEFVPECLRGDREVVAAAVSSNGSALRLATEPLRLDPDIALLAVRNSASALQHAHPVLQGDLQFLSSAIAVNGDALDYAPEELRTHPDVMNAARAHWRGETGFPPEPTRRAGEHLNHAESREAAERQEAHLQEVLERLKGGNV